MTTTIERFTQWARDNPQRQYTALVGLLSSPIELLACWRRLKTDHLDRLVPIEY